MDSTYSCFFIFVFVAIILTILFRCKLKCGTCSKSENYDFLPTTGNLPTGEGGYLLEGDNLGKFDYVNNDACMQCMRDHSSTQICFPYCIRGSVI